MFDNYNLSTYVLWRPRLEERKGRTGRCCLPVGSSSLAICASLVHWQRSKLRVPSPNRPLIRFFVPSFVPPSTGVLLLPLPPSLPPSRLKLRIPPTTHDPPTSFLSSYAGSGCGGTTVASDGCSNLCCRCPPAAAARGSYQIEGRGCGQRGFITVLGGDETSGPGGGMERCKLPEGLLSPAGLLMPRSASSMRLRKHGSRKGNVNQ